MCGIAGFAGYDLSQDDSRDRIRSMCDAIYHRGPDDDGYLVSRGVALGMRRLSIIDVAGGKQPIFNADGSIGVVFNGEIYNHHELRKELIGKGYQFRTSSDTEVLVHLYEEYGENMFARLRGMFGFAIWDQANQKLVIARDRPGMKPLYYAEHDGGLVFCSELRSLLAFMPATPSIDASSVMSYFALGYVPDPTSIFSGVRKLPPAHYLTWQPGKPVDVRAYWTVPPPDRSMENEEDVIEQLRVHLERAVESHLESEVPLGAFLSGGLDSSTVVALMSRIGNEPVRTFSIGFDEAEFDESEAAKEIASHFGTQHTSLIIRPDIEETFESIATMFDEPFGDSSAIPTYCVARIAREDVTVALSGDGGDELFGGYTRYSEALGHSASLGPAGSLLSTCARLLPQGAPGRNRLIDMGRSSIGRYLAKISNPLRLDEGGFASTTCEGAQTYSHELLAEHVAEVAGMNFADAMMVLDYKTYLPGDILTKVDRTSMAVSLEARVPLLDFDLVDFAFSIPGEHRVTRHGGKHLFRKAISKWLPEWLFARPKQGFAIPLADWFHGPLRGRLDRLTGTSSHLKDFVDERALRRIVREHTSGRRDHSLSLWRLTVLDTWLDALSNGDLAHPPTAPEVRR